MNHESIKIIDISRLLISIDIMGRSLINIQKNLIYRRKKQ